MADLTLVTGYVPFERSLRDSGVTRVEFSGTGADSTAIAAAGGAGTRHIIVGGRCSFDSAGRLDILSGATVKDSIEFVARGSALLPKGLEMGTNGALNLQKVTATTCRGWIDYATIKDGDFVGTLGKAT